VRLCELLKTQVGDVMMHMQVHTVL
jgi:hypothetical protein